MNVASSSEIVVTSCNYIVIKKYTNKKCKHKKMQGWDAKKYVGMMHEKQRSTYIGKAPSLHLFHSIKLDSEGFI